MNKFFLIDKPLGITSFDVIRELKKKLKIKRIGHTGTLDPLASGLLLIAVGNYTKLIPYFEKDFKEYFFKIMLDGTTQTMDLEKDVIFCDEDILLNTKKNLSLEKLNHIIKTKFTGEISQTPPKYSALKIGGKKAVDLVRAGVDFEMKTRKTTIKEINILSYDFPEVYLQATVSAGTYIRSIADDLGKEIGTGGYISFLRRSKIGSLDLSLSQTLKDFDIDNFLNEKYLFPNTKYISLDDENLLKINNGMSIENIFGLDDGVEYFVKNDQFITNIICVKNNLIIPIKKII